MKGLTVLFIIFMMIMMIVPQSGNSQGYQGARGAVASESAAPGRGGSTPAAGPPAYAGGAAAAAVASSSPSAGTGSYSGYYGGGTSGDPVNLQGTSFGSLWMYQDFNNYYYYLCSHFNLNPSYFDRFYRHTEPLITPEMLRLTLRTPIRLSSRMLDSIDQLEAMLRDVESGKTIDRKALLNKSREIREFAKQIRRNQTLQHFDLREDTDLFKQDENGLSLEALDRIRAMAVDLDHQLRNMYSQTATSTISVENYKQPSLESLAKGIERLCKNIEKSAKNM
jgi:hypothetical protein